MAFGTATVVTTVGKTTIADRLKNTPTRNSPRYPAMGTGATSAARTAVVGDTALSTEVETPRTVGTDSSTTNVFQVVGTITATASRAVDEAGLFDATTAGNMFTSATFAAINLASGDSIQFTWQVTIS